MLYPSKQGHPYTQKMVAAVCYCLRPNAGRLLWHLILGTALLLVRQHHRWFQEAPLGASIKWSKNVASPMVGPLTCQAPRHHQGYHGTLVLWSSECSTQILRSRSALACAVKQIRGCGGCGRAIAGIGHARPKRRGSVLASRSCMPADHNHLGAWLGTSRCFSELSILSRQNSVFSGEMGFCSVHPVA